MIRKRHALSERRACKLTGQSRSTQRYETVKASDEDALTQDIRALSLKHPRFGYRRITALLRAAGWGVNRKRVHRLWKKMGLKVYQRRRKRRRVGQSSNSSQKSRATHKDHVWSYDFVADQTEDGKRLKTLVVVDEFTRECLAIETWRSFPAHQVKKVLSKLFKSGRMPEHIRSDNGPEFIETALRKWFKDIGIKTLFIEPGSPWENAYVESFNARLRDELLDRELFSSLLEAKIKMRRYQNHYNEERPHSSLGYLTPRAFAERASNDLQDSQEPIVLPA